MLAEGCYVFSEPSKEKSLFSHFRTTCHGNGNNSHFVKIIYIFAESFYVKKRINKSANQGEILLNKSAICMEANGAE